MLVDALASNHSLIHSPFSTDFDSYLHILSCLVIKPSSFIFILTRTATIFILLPIMIFILCHSVEQWRQSVSSSPAAKMCHSDVFTYHMAVIELIGVFGCILLLSVSITNQKDSDMLLVGGLVSEFHYEGQTFFHVLTCLERYLAVVHPITYLNLRNERGIIIRNILIGCVWLLCFVRVGVKMTKQFFISEMCIFGFSLFVVFFCTCSVLFVLIRPGPGDQCAGREKVDQSKQRAFYTIVTIMGTLMLRFMGSLVWKLVFRSVIRNGCLIMAGVAWTGLPSSLVLPLLFLNRAGKLVWYKNHVQSLKN